jgi:Fic family protein
MKNNVNNILKMNLLERLLTEKSVKLKGGLYHYTQVKFSYNTNKIEGSTISEEDTEYIFKDNRIGVLDKKSFKVDDIVETRNHFKCLDKVLETTSKELSEDIIKEYHKILKSGTSDEEKQWFIVGGYKKVDNRVGGMDTTEVKNVEKEMKILLGKYNKIEKKKIDDIIEFHYKFERIHPFQDGNGRVGRLIIFKECLKNNIVPLIINDEKKEYYYKGLREYTQNKNYLMNICRYEQTRYSSILDYFKVKYDKKTVSKGIRNNDSKIMEELYFNIKNKRQEIEEYYSSKKNRKYYEGYLEEIRDAEKKVFKIAYVDIVDQNYNEELIELGAICKLKEEELINKQDLKSMGKTRFLIDLRTGINNTIKALKVKKRDILFTGITLEDDDEDGKGNVGKGKKNEKELLKYKYY